MPQYSFDSWGNHRSGVGAFNFDNPTSGHIGAFYLNDSVDVTHYISDPVKLYLSAIPPDVNVVGGQGIVVNVNNEYPRIILTVPAVSVIVNKDLDVNIIADRWCGSSPLTVNFIADPLFLKDLSSIYEIEYCYWNFDAGNTSGYSTSAVGVTISHEFSGYFNQQYGIKVEAHFKRKVANNNYPSTQIATSEIKYVRLCGLDDIRYTYNRELNLTNYIPGMYRNTDV